MEDRSGGSRTLRLSLSTTLSRTPSPDGTEPPSPISPSTGQPGSPRSYSETMRKRLWDLGSRLHRLSRSGSYSKNPTADETKTSNVSESSECLCLDEENPPQEEQNQDYGHVFILLADITSLACDAWVGAAGGQLDISAFDSFHSINPRPVPVRKKLENVDTHICGFDPWPEDRPLVYTANIDRYSVRGDPLKTALLCGDFVDVAAADLVNRPPLNGRCSHLIALPLLGSGGGGVRTKTGELVKHLLPVLVDKSFKNKVDVAIVTIEEICWAAAQSERVRGFNGFENIFRPYLRDELIQEGIKLADHALQGRLALFFGAGVSCSAGLPTWWNLLKDLAVIAGISKEQLPDLQALTFYDQARIIERRLVKINKTIGETVAELLGSKVYSTAHALLASLPVHENITTNYDILFEEAFTKPRVSRFSEEEYILSVLPHKPRPDSSKWLLKMHGCITQPSDIVLTRRDYIRYAERGAALGGVVQAALLTKHLLFVGFSLTDDNFHKVFDAVLKAMPKTAHDKQVQALLLSVSPLQSELWEGEVGLLSIADPALQGSPPELFSVLSRRQDIFLDLIAAGCCVKGRASYLLQDRFDMMLTTADRELKTALRTMVGGLSKDARETPAFKVVAKALDDLGGKHLASSTNAASKFNALLKDIAP